jgi:hypothetical protein
MKVQEMSPMELTLRLLGGGQEVADLVGVSRRTVVRWRADGHVTRRRDAKILAAEVQGVLPCATVEALMRG